jgi:filamentous hemagglutinin
MSLEDGAKEALNILAAARTGTALRTPPRTHFPTYRQLSPWGVQTIQIHHILPRYLGKMIGYKESDMLDHPAAMLTQWEHQGKANADAVHKLITAYLPLKRNGVKMKYTAEQIDDGLFGAYHSLGLDDWYYAVEPLIIR